MKRDLKHKTLIFDFDSTIITLESLDFLADLALRDHGDREKIVQKIKELTDLGMSGEITFDESLSRRLALVAPTKEQIAKAAEQISECITKSFLENKEFFAAHREDIYIVSGGFEELILPAIKKLHIKPDHVFANKFIFNEAGRVSGVDSSRLTSKHLGKVKQLQQLDLPKPIVIIGDGYTDYEIKKNGIADHFIAYTEQVERQNVVPNSDHQARTFSDILISLIK